MMCEKIQEQILTDYLDGQLDDRQKKVIEAHLAVCPRCREFAATAQKAVVEPFTLAPQIQPPEIVWDKIQASILEQRLRPNALAGWVRTLKQVLLPRPAFAFATGFVFLVFAVVILARLNEGSRQASIVHPREQMEYLASLAQPSSDGGNNEDASYGTTIEQYFL